MANDRSRLKRALSLLLITCLTALPLAGCSARGSSRVNTGGGVPPKGEWSDVAKLARGSAIRVTLKGGQPASRNFVGANESELIVLNLTDATLPRQVTRPLRNMASDEPFELIRVSHGETLTKDHLRLGPDGIFLDGRKVAAVEQVVELVARNNVVEISRMHRATKRGFGWVH